MERIGVAFVSTIVAGVALSGCGGSSGSRAAEGATSTTSAAVGPVLNGEQSKTANQVLADTKSALLNVTAVHVTGTVGVGDQALQFDMHLQGQESSGSITTTTGTTNLILIGGKVYSNYPAGYWRGRTTPAAAARLEGKWLVLDAKLYETKDTFLTLEYIASLLNPTTMSLTPNVISSDLDGQKVVVLTGDDGTTFNIANTGEPVPLTLTDTTSSNNLERVSFTEYGQPITITAPAGAITPEAAKSGTAGAPAAAGA